MEAMRAAGEMSKGHKYEDDWRVKDKPANKGGRGKDDPSNEPNYQTNKRKQMEDKTEDKTLKAKGRC